MTTANRLARFKPKLSLQAASKLLWSLVRAVIVFGLCFQILYPFIVKILQAFMSQRDLLDPTVSLYPREWDVYFWRYAFDLMDYVGSALNTLLVSLPVSVLQMLVCTVAGYGFARFKFRGRGLLFALVLVSLLVPPALYSTPLYLYFRFFGAFGLQINLIDTPLPSLILSLVGLGLKNGLYIYLMRQFFRGMPRELEEAAYIDGYGPFMTFWRVMLPSARNMLLTIFVLSFSWQWTDVFYSTLFNNKTKTLSLAILRNITELVTAGEFTILRNTAAILTVLPLLVIFIFAQRKLIEGIERSGIVG